MNPPREFQFGALPRRSQSTCRYGRNRRRGIAIILVLGLMAIAIALTYAMMRSQVMSTLVQQNLNRDFESQQAAQAGMTIALRKLHDDTWPGFSSSDSASVSGTLSANQSYSATYTVGDPRLTAASADFSRYPYRVTVTVVGTATSPGSSQSSTHSIRTIVELLPRQLAAEPSNWGLAQGYTVYQWKDNSSKVFQIGLPAHIDGPVRIRSGLELLEVSNNDKGGISRYLQDLTAMGTTDFRPFNNMMDLPFAYTPTTTRDLLTTTLNVTQRDTTTPTDNALSDFGLSGQTANYRLFPKGKLYSGSVIPDQINNVTLAPNPLTNPLGLFITNSDADIGANVQLTGTLLSRGDIRFSGANVEIRPATLFGLDGASAPIQLPVLATEGSLNIQSGTFASVNGLIFVGGQFHMEVAPQANILFSLSGRLLIKEMKIEPRFEWGQSSGFWQSNLAHFRQSTEQFFPVWMELNVGLDVQPCILIGPPTANVSYHWRKLADTVYVSGSSDGGLRWNTLEWRDNP